MAYEPTSWKAGDIVTSAKLNKMEQGIAGAGALIVHVDENDTLDKTWQEIHDAVLAVIVSDDEINVVVDVDVVSRIYRAVNLYKVETTNNVYSTDSPDGYPEMKDD